MRNHNTDFIVRVVRGTGKTRYFTDWLEEKTQDGSLKIKFRLDDEGYISDKITESDIQGTDGMVKYGF